MAGKARPPVGCGLLPALEEGLTAPLFDAPEPRRRAQEKIHAIHGRIGISSNIEAVRPKKLAAPYKNLTKS